jgi:hypothetical protein
MPNDKLKKPRLSIKFGIPNEKTLHNKLYTGPEGKIFAKTKDRPEPTTAPTIIIKIMTPILLLIIPPLNFLP